MVAALKFFLGKDEGDDENDSDSDDEVCYLPLMFCNHTLY